MKAEQQVIVALLKVRVGTGDQRPDVIGVSAERRLDVNAHFGRELSGDFADALDGGFEAGHRVMWKERDEQEIGRAFCLEPANRLGDRGILIAHGELDREVGAEAFLERVLNVAADDDERGAFRSPDFLVGVRGFLGA